MAIEFDVGGWGAQEETYYWVKHQLARFSYKPGWVFEASRRPEMGGIMVKIAFHAPDSRAGELYGDWVSEHTCPHCNRYAELARHTIPITGEFVIDPYVTRAIDPEAAFFDWLKRTLSFMDVHERDEWVRVDGKLLHDPHEEVRSG